MAKLSFSASTLVTVHANRRVIGVPVHAAMIGVCLRLAGVRRSHARMTSINAGKDRIVCRINMTISAYRSVMWNHERRVIEHGSQPGCSYPRRVTRSASRRVGCRHVIGHVRPVILCGRVIRLVASVAIRGRIARGVIAADVAVRASIYHRPDRTGDCGAWRKHVRTL